MKDIALVIVCSVMLFGAGMFAGCGTNSTNDKPLNVHEVRLAVLSLNEELAGRISKLDDDIRSLRGDMTLAATYGLLGIDQANLIQQELMLADYFMSRGWSSLVENKLKESLELTMQGEGAVKLASDMLAKEMTEKHMQQHEGKKQSS